MKTLLQAIYTKFSVANTFKTAINGRLYFNEAPEDPTFPYATYHLIDANPEFELGSKVHEEYTLQISIFDDDSSAVDLLTAFGYMKTLFDDVVLSVSGYNSITFEREQSIGPVKDMVYNTWAIHTDYNILLEDQ